MTRRRLVSFASILLLSTPAVLCQQVPVTCGHTADSPIPSRPLLHPRPSAQQAEQTTRIARAQAGFITMNEPANLDIARYRIADYADCILSSFCYWNDLATQTARAQTELKRLAATRKPGEKLAMVLDIDETSLSSYCEEKREDFGYISPMYNQWLVSTDASIPIPGTLALFNQARAADVAVFFITGRAGVKGALDDQTEATARNLMLAGYKGWQGLTLRDESQRNMDTTEYKSEERQKIVDQHYRIILSVGDQWSDLNGSAGAEISVKLPNPFYYLP
ncbi:MAG TPA: HAD family acid phosphatase [Edaphobacter sp.]|nr:HAD family acid phosphatase [Edaphobacter sp.]